MAHSFTLCTQTFVGYKNKICSPFLKKSESLSSQKFGETCIQGVSTRTNQNMIVHWDAESWTLQFPSNTYGLPHVQLHKSVVQMVLQPMLVCCSARWTLCSKTHWRKGEGSCAAAGLSNCAVVTTWQSPQTCSVSPVAFTPP